MSADLVNVNTSGRDQRSRRGARCGRQPEISGASAPWRHDPTLRTVGCRFRLSPRGAQRHSSGPSATTVGIVMFVLALIGLEMTSPAHALEGGRYGDV